MGLPHNSVFVLLLNSGFEGQMLIYYAFMPCLRKEIKIGCRNKKRSLNGEIQHLKGAIGTSL